jgi:hypothetical protein
VQTELSEIHKEVFAMSVKKGLAGGWIANIDAEWWYGYRNNNPVGTKVIDAQTTISVNTTDNSFNDSASGFTGGTYVFAVGDRLKTEGFSNSENNGFFRITSVTASKLVVTPEGEDDLVTESAGQSVTLWEAMEALNGAAPVRSSDWTTGTDFIPALLGEGLYDPNIPSNHTGYILFLSEPEPATAWFVGGQSWHDGTAEDAADLYYEHYNSNYTSNLAGTSSSSAKFVVGGLMVGDANSESYEWMEDFIARCEDQGYDLPAQWAFHVYGWGYDRVSEGDNSFVDQLNKLIAIQERLKELYDTTEDIPIWITETGNQLGVTRWFKDQLLTWDALDWVDRFGVFPGYKISDTPYSNKPVGYVGLWGKLYGKAVDIMSALGPEQANANRYTAPAPIFSGISVGDRLWLAGWDNEANDGFHWVTDIDESAHPYHWIEVAEDLVTEIGWDDEVYIYQNGWSLDMRLWDSTDNEITPMGQIFKDFEEDTSMIHMFDEQKIALEEVTVTVASGWNNVDLTDFSVPAAATGVICRVAGDAPAGINNAVGFYKAEDTSECDIVIRDVHDSGYLDDHGILRLDGSTAKAYYHAWGSTFTHVWLVILGYIL